MPKRLPHSLSKTTVEIIAVLGEQVQAARRVRKWPAAELAQRAGISENTLRSIERGAPTVAIGSYLEVAVILGVPLYGDVEARDVLRAAVRGRLPLLGKRVRSTPIVVDDDF
jgi:transcriptional regulator with XRE-family HTH domain